MRRRRFVQALAGGSAAQALLGQQPGANQSAPGVPLNSTVGVQPPPAAAEALPILSPTVADVAADGATRFFSAAQFAALSRLSVALAPGALDAETPEFLDFLISESLPDRQRVYREGLDALNSQAQKKFSKAFVDLDDSQAATLLAPLRQPWTYAEPSDAAARFLRAAKQDVRIATTNSAGISSGRRFSGAGQYWYPLD